MNYILAVEIARACKQDHSSAVQDFRILLKLL